jgi:hypothetical protein
MFRFRYYQWACEHPRHGIPQIADLERDGWKRIANARDYPDSWLMGITETGSQPSLISLQTGKRSGKGCPTSTSET